MNAPIDTIEGIGPTYRGKLEAAGVRTVEGLIERCGSILGRKEVATLTGLREGQIDKWVRTADLMRVNGVGKEYSQLLTAAGVQSIETLRTRNPEMLCTRLNEVNDQKRLARRSPALHEVSAWVGAARTMEQRVH